MPNMLYSPEMRPTQERLKQLFNYDPDTGLFTRKIAVAYRSKIGEIAGGPQNFGHIGIRVEGRRYLAHRLAWLYVYGEWPRYIDHINGISSDNRISNLRECTQAENCRNSKIPRNNTTGYKGVYALPRGRWRAMITVSNRTISLGCFGSIEEARRAYDEGALHHHGEFARLNQSRR